MKKQLSHTTIQSEVEKALDRLLCGDVLESEYLTDREGAWFENGQHGLIRTRIPYYHDPNKRQQIIDRFNSIETADNLLVIYRGIERETHLGQSDIGISWTFDINSAYCYRSTNQFPYWYKYYSLVSVDSVNWIQTVQKAMVLHSHEKEILLFPQSLLAVFKIEKLKKTTCELIESYEEPILATS